MSIYHEPGNVTPNKADYSVHIHILSLEDDNL